MNLVKLPLRRTFLTIEITAFFLASFVAQAEVEGANVGFIPPFEKLSPTQIRAIKPYVNPQKAPDTSNVVPDVEYNPFDEDTGQPFDNNRYAGRWELISIDGKAVLDRFRYFIISGMKLYGNDGCNQFGGRFDRPGGGPKTRILCMGNPIISLDFSDLAEHFRSGTLDEDKGLLSLPKRGQYPAYVFKRVKEDKQPK